MQFNFLKLSSLQIWKRTCLFAGLSRNNGIGRDTNYTNCHEFGGEATSSSPLAFGLCCLRGTRTSLLRPIREDSCLSIGMDEFHLVPFFSWRSPKKACRSWNTVASSFPLARLLSGQTPRFNQGRRESRPYRLKTTLPAL